MSVIDYKRRCYATYEKIMSVISSVETRSQYSSCFGWIINVYKNLQKERPDDISFSEWHDLNGLVDRMKENSTNALMDMLDKINNKNMEITTTERVKRHGEIAEHLQYHKKLFNDAKKILQGKYAIIPYSENSFMLYHIHYVSDMSRFGYKQVELEGESILFRVNENGVSCYEYIYNTNSTHWIGKYDLNACLVVDKMFWDKYTYYLGTAFRDIERIDMVYNNIRDHYKISTGKTIEYAAREASDAESMVSE